MAAPNLVALADGHDRWHFVAVDSKGTLWCGLWDSTTPHITWIKATQTWVTSTGSVEST